MSTSTAVIDLLLISYVAWQLVTGKVIDRYWRVRPMRPENPMAYWFLTISECIGLLLFIYIGRGT